MATLGTMTRPVYEKTAALALVADGWNDCRIARHLGIPRGTIRDWRRPTYLPQDPTVNRQDCPLCHGTTLDAGWYCYLLGLYLGDGFITHMKRGVFKLRIVLDLAYPNIIDECYGAIIAIRSEGVGRAGFAHHAQGHCVEVNGYWKHWPCLFPQHGYGRKHERRIVLANWQRDLVAANPDMLLRGLVQSDGCRVINAVRAPKTKKLYYYPRYFFTGFGRHKGYLL